MRMTQEELSSYYEKQKASFTPIKETPQIIVKRKNKYNAIPRMLDNFLFHSTSESKYYEKLKRRVKCEELRYFLRQVPLHLPGGVKLIVDFMLVYPDGRIEFVDVKGGKVTEAWRVKQKVAEAVYPIKIRIVRRQSKDGSFKLYGEI